MGLCFLFSFSAKKAYAFLPLAEAHLYSQIVCTDVFPVPVMTSSFSLLNLFPLRLPIQPSIFIHSFLPSYSRQQLFVLEQTVSLESVLT